MIKSKKNTIKHSKLCIVCGLSFTKNKKLSFKQWESQMICSNKCSGIVISQKKTGVSQSEGHKLKISNANKGRKPYEMTEDIKNKISKKLAMGYSEGLLKARKGPESNLWAGGVWNSGYSVDWTQTLRRAIRERDMYTCQICHIPQGDMSLDIHHIDYDKKNSDISNLISLCRVCHIKTNFKRDYWINYFKNK